MADDKVSQKTEITVMPSQPSDGALYLIRKMSGIWESRRISLYNFFRTVTANTNIVGTLKVHKDFTANSFVTMNANATLLGGKTRVMNLNANTVTITDKATPANSTISISGGRLFYDNNYLYIATANNVLKRISLSSF